MTQEFPRPNGHIEIDMMSKPNATSIAHLVILHEDGDRFPRTICNVEVSDAWVRRDGRARFVCRACEARLAFVVEVVEWWSTR